jgi:hypothetical protein
MLEGSLGDKVVAIRHGRVVRTAIGWIAAYSLALNIILSGLLFPQASAASSIAFDVTGAFDATGALCLTSHSLGDSGLGDSGQVDPDGKPDGTHRALHCGLCAVSLSVLAAMVANVVAVLKPAQSLIVPSLSAGKTSDNLKSLPGCPRAPPTVA